MLSKITLRKCVKSKIKQLCCGDEFSDYIETEIPKLLVSTQALAVEQSRKDTGERIE